MIEINLLPKDYLKKSIDFSLGKTGLYGIVAAAGIVIMLIGITFYQKYQLSKLEDNISKAQQRAAMLQKDIKVVDALMDVKKKITERMSAVEKLDSHRSAWVRILEDFARDVPEFVWLGKFREKPQETLDKSNNKDGNKNKKQNTPSTTSAVADNSVPTVRKGEIEGYAFTLNALASFMIKMMRSDYFDEVELVSTNEINLQDKKAYDFVLNFNIHYLSDEQLRKVIASVDNKSTAQKAKTTHKSLN